MNNCYGRNGDMQMQLIKVYTTNGETYYAKCCVSDTDDTEAQKEEIIAWVDANLLNVKCYEIVEGIQDLSGMKQVFYMADMDENEFELFLPNAIYQNKAEWDMKNIHTNKFPSSDGAEYDENVGIYESVSVKKELKELVENEVDTIFSKLYDTIEKKTKKLYDGSIIVPDAFRMEEIAEELVEIFLRNASMNEMEDN